MQGDLARAAELWLEAAEPDQAARVLIARSDAELDPKTRLIFLGRAVDLAPAGSDWKKEARRKRALIRVELAKVGALAAALRHDLREAAEELESLGESAMAAEAFRLAGDQEGHARALVAAGAVEELEQVLHDDVAQERSSREAKTGALRIESLIAGGERRAALEACEALLREHPESPGVRARLDELRSARLLAPIVRVAFQADRPKAFVLGSEVRIGRTEGEIVVPHAAVSRTHVRIYRDAAGVPHLADAGSGHGAPCRAERAP